MSFENCLTNTNDIKIANELNEVEFNLRSMSFDLLCVMLSQITKKDNKFKYYELFISIIEKRINRKLNRTSLKKAATELKAATVFLENRAIKWFEFFEYDSSSGIIKVKFNEDLKPYLIQVPRKFTLVKLYSILNLNGYYSKRLYLLLAQYLKMTKWTYNLKELQELLSVSDSMKKSYSNFKLRVLEPAIEDINKKSNIIVSYEEMKISRTVISIMFRIKSKPKKNKSETNIKKESSGVSAVEDWYNSQKEEVIDTEVFKRTNG